MSLEAVNVEVPEGPGYFSLLPDDAVVRVFAFLGVRELLGVRAVCRRWRDLALDPDAWHHRVLRDSRDRTVFSAVLRLAPCVGRLAMQSAGAFEFCSILAANTTRCAARSLELDIGHGRDAGIAGAILPRQASLGRLKRVFVKLWTLNKEYQRPLDFLMTFPTIEGLEELSFNVKSRMALYPLLGPPATFEPRVPSSLRRFRFAFNKTGPHAVFHDLLRTHAETLTAVILEDTSSTSRFFSTAVSLLPHLSQLQCPPLEGMAALLQCGDLSDVTLVLSEPLHNNALRDTKYFLLEATRLKSVHLRYCSPDLPDEGRLVFALAGGSSPVEALRVSYGVRLLVSARNKQLEMLASALLGLPCLRSLTLPEGYVPDVLIGALGELSCLTWLQVQPYECVHHWVRSARVAQLVKKNPRLHISLAVKWCSSCKRCSKECRLPQGEAVFFGHADDFECDHVHGVGERVWYRL